MSAPEIMKRHRDYAEVIIKSEGFTFALAASAGKEGDLREARGLLKEAICKALASEFALGLAAQGMAAKIDAARPAAEQQTGAK